MCFVRVNTKHQPIKPPGAAPTLTHVYDTNILETSIDIGNPTSQRIVASLNVNEKLQSHDLALPPIRKVSVEEVIEKRKGKNRETMPHDRRSSSSIRDNTKTGSKERTAMTETEKERQRSLEILGSLHGG